MVFCSVRSVDARFYLLLLSVLVCQVTRELYSPRNDKSSVDQSFYVALA